MTAPRPTWWSRSRATASPPCAPASPAPAGAVRLAGLTLPGFANAHSHAFHRALRGRTHGGAGSFWTWRPADVRRRRRRSTPTGTTPSPGRRTARWRWPGSAPSASSTTSTTVPAACPTPSPTRWPRHSSPRRPMPAIRITLLDACYLRGGPAIELDPVQQRFTDRTVEQWATTRRPAAGRPARRHRGGRPLDARRRPRRHRDRRRVGRGARRAAARPRLRAAGRERAGAGRPRRHAGRDPGRRRRPGRALHGRARHPPDDRRRRPARGGRRAPAASARRPSATSPTASGRRSPCAMPAPA